MPDVRVGVVNAPTLSDELTAGLVDDIRGDLEAGFPDMRWHLQLLDDGLVEPPAEDGQIVGAARQLLLTRAWDLVVVLTDLPLAVARRPVVAHASPMHGVAVLSVPALGSLAVRRRLRDAVPRLIGALLGEVGDDGADGRTDAARWRRISSRLRELGSEVEGEVPSFRFTTRVFTGHLRLLFGMVRANRPWQLAARLSRALTAAAAAGVFALVTPDIWSLAGAFRWQRLAVVSVVSVLAIAMTLIVGARLWERASDPRARQQVVLFNIATTATVVIGVAAFYAALFVLSLLGGLLLVVPSVLADAISHPVTFGDYVEVAWLTSSLATVGGALGAGLESDEAVRRAAYTYRTSRATEHGGG
ncbi:hypothetical protein SAMN05660209_04675 [Geodermatophilus africanus]|uniref:Uncharacterized protein n=1 Tax=Geodermatophilus africanus TaxID=1137993 RepID=A0A1H3QA88_9ACTN|nr:hypothetical protein [Geodermatophilus africanus]SDZ10306.1 hypothetical protein SAMN05660209_04675 [Geodermatophilus africanus]